MLVRVLALAALLVPLAATAEEGADQKPATRMALTGDFVDLGTGHPGVSRSKAAIELVNLTKHPLDVKLGYGAGRIEAGKSLLVRIDAGEQPLEVSSPALPGESLGGPLQLQKGHAYAVGIAWQEVLVGDAPAAGLVPASPKSAAAGKAKGEPAPVAKTQTQAAGKDQKGPPWNKGKKSGRVDIGRKRKKDR